MVRKRTCACKLACSRPNRNGERGSVLDDVMKLLSSAAVLICVLVGAVAAPAFSSGRWHPKPVDFELAPTTSLASASGGGFTSQALKAPKRFNLVGLRWRGRAEPRVTLRV